MNAAPCSCRVVTKRIGLSSSASMMSMFSSPGMPKTYSTPSFSRHLTRSCAAFIAESASRVATHTLHDRFGDFLRRRLPAEVARAHVVFVHGRVDRSAHALREILTSDVVEHQCRRVHERERIRDPLAGDVRRRSMHGLEDGGVLADV